MLQYSMTQKITYTKLGVEKLSSNLLFLSNSMENQFGHNS